MEKSWMRKWRTSEAYVKGAYAFVDNAIRYFLQFRNIDKQVKDDDVTMPCPCKTCVNRLDKQSKVVRLHLFKYCIMEGYTNWTRHGEKEEPSTSAAMHFEHTTEFGLEGGAINTDIASDKPTDGPTTKDMLEATYDTSDEPEDVKFQQLLADAEKPLYPDSPKFIKLAAILDLLHLKGNELVDNTYEAKKITKILGSGYRKIHACVNNCLIYYKLDENLTVCRTCGTTRWKVDENTKQVYENVLTKVMWYFPIIPRLQRLFKLESLSEDLRWHATRKITEGILRHPADSPAWLTIDEKYPKFAKDPRNLRLGISADGVDVNRGNRQHSVWPILALIYNLPPWLCMKRKFIMLSVLISGYPGKEIDVFLEPLVDDLQRLSEEGVKTYLPYAHPFRKQTKAFNGERELGAAPIPKTGEEIHNEVQQIENRWGKGNKSTKKPSEHVEDGRGGGGKIKKGKRKRKTGPEEGSSSQADEEDAEYWKKFNIWYRKLPYWRHNSVQHCIDFMHIEKNMGESLIATLLYTGKSKDGLNARLDLAQMKIKPELYATEHNGKTKLPLAGYTLTNDEKDKFCETLFNIKAPQGYCSNFSSLVSLKDRKLIGLKSHDYHMLMQESLPIAIRSIMHPPTRYAIIRFWFFFRSICSKEIVVEKLDKMKKELCVTLCPLEKFFPPSFFDIMVHFTVHLTREVKLCGPICFRWMYPFERHMKDIKRHVRNRFRPEGCIAEETIAQEKIEILAEYKKSMTTNGIPNDEHDISTDEDGKPQLPGKPTEVSKQLLDQAHLCVLFNTADIAPYIERHMELVKKQNPGKRAIVLQNVHIQTFAKWVHAEVLKERQIANDTVSEIVRWITLGPQATIVKYDAYNIGGYLFRTKSRDGRVHQNSGVCVEALDVHISEEVETTKKRYYYGVLQEIWVLDYKCRQIPLFKCDWVNHKNGGVKRDTTLGYTLVELNNIGRKMDPFVVAAQARQVFYVNDQLTQNIYLMLRAPPKNYKVTYDDVDEDFSTVVDQEHDYILPSVHQSDLGNESRTDYYRDDIAATVVVTRKKR